MFRHMCAILRSGFQLQFFYHLVAANFSYKPSRSTSVILNIWALSFVHLAATVVPVALKLAYFGVNFFLRHVLLKCMLALYIENLRFVVEALYYKLEGRGFETR
jgi:hypothetical protein